MPLRTVYCPTCARPLGTRRAQEGRRYPVREPARYCGSFCRSMKPDRDAARNAVIQLLYYVRGLSYSEIAARYAMTKQNVAHVLRRR